MLHKKPTRHGSIRDVPLCGYRRPSFSCGDTCRQGWSPQTEISAGEGKSDLPQLSSPRHSLPFWPEDPIYPWQANQDAHNAKAQTEGAFPQIDRGDSGPPFVARLFCRCNSSAALQVDRPLHLFVFSIFSTAKLSCYHSPDHYIDQYSLQPIASTGAGVYTNDPLLRTISSRSRQHTTIAIIRWPNGGASKVRRSCACMAARAATRCFGFSASLSTVSQLP